VLVVDDEAPIRRFLRIALTSEDYEVTESSRAADAFARVTDEIPDLIVLDLGLPDWDGQTLLREIRTRTTSPPIIILSVRADETEKVEALDAGANDYVTKPFGLPEFLARVRNLLRRPPSDEPNTAFRDDRLAIDLQSGTVELDGVPLRLTPKELDVLHVLVQNAGRVVTQRYLLQQVWGATHTSDTHYLRIIVGRLRQKLGDDPTDPTYIQTEAGIGYRFRGPPTQPPQHRRDPPDNRML
jgi:two-component system KDP operon response regulator KdpE